MIARVVSTAGAAAMLGISTETFLARRRDGTLPIEPVPYCATRYDTKMIEQYLDSCLQGESAAVNDYDKIVAERLANRGKNHRQISR